MATGSFDEKAWCRLALAALWLPLLWRLTPAWSASVEQAYGWAVPLLALYLAGERARWAPARVGPSAIGRAAAWGGLLLAAGALPVLLTILEANGSWPLAQWVAWATVAAATFALLTLDGGAARARHFAFPVFFLATALTWPAAVTTRLVAGLMNLNAQLAATAVSVFGHPAVVSGNVIEVAGGFVGVDEACSGLLSLQSAWMAGWFFGELFWLGAARRAGLVAGAVAVAVVGNWIRTTALTWIAAADSPEASAAWHDRAGGFELAGTLVAVALLAWAWGGRKARQPATTRHPAASGARAAWRVAAVAGLGAAILPVAWYRHHEAQAGPRTQWSLRSPGPEWVEYRMPEAAEELLRSTSSAGWVRNDPATRTRAYALMVAWDGDGAAALSAEAHDPTICLPAAGFAARVRSEPEVLEVDGIQISFTVAQLTADGRGQHVFYGHWDAWLGRTRGALRSDVSSVPGWRLERAWLGRRRGDVSYLAFVVPLADEAQARAWLAEWAPRMLRPR